MEISVLDRQKAVLMQRLYQNQTTTPHHHHHQVWPNQDMIIDHYNNSNVMMHSRFPVFDDHHHRSNNNCSNNSPTTTTRVEMSNHHCSNSSSFVSRDNNNANCSIKKRKAEYDVQKQEEQEEADESLSQSQSQSAITTKNNEKANSSEKSKVSDGQQKPDYIHVRARRGQATDSHSLAERARREKISKKMKCLQDLVPGCNRATGKAGMLDEIINYVQSLQKQVEFLSMKLAVLNPRLDFSIDDFFAKEMPAYIASLPTATQYEAADATASFAHNSITSNHGFDIAMNNQPQKVSPSSLASSMQIPEAFLDPSFIHQLQQMSGLESEFPNLYNMGLH